MRENVLHMFIIPTHKYYTIFFKFGIWCVKDGGNAFQWTVSTWNGSMWTQKQEQRKAIFFSSVCDNIHCRHIRSFSLLGYMFFFRAVEDINRVLFTQARKLCVCWDQHTCVAFQSPHRNRSSYKSKGKCTSKNGNNNDIREKSQQLAIESSICMECVTFCPVRTQFVAAFNVCMFVFFFISLSYF